MLTSTMKGKYATVPFGSLAVGEKFWLTNSLRSELYGPYTKTEPILCEKSRAFYASHNCEFHGWNATRPYWDGDKMSDGGWSLDPNTECVRDAERRAP